MSTTAGTLPNKRSEVSKPLRTWLGHFWITVRKCSVDNSEVLFRGVHRTLPNRYSEVSYAAIFPFNPVSCRFHWLISSFSCSQMILHIYLITVCTYFEPGRPWADIIQEINKKSKNSNFLLFTKWLPDLDWFTAWITLGIEHRHFRIKVRKCPEPLPRAGNSTSNWAVQNARCHTVGSDSDSMKVTVDVQLITQINWNLSRPVWKSYKRKSVKSSSVTNSL